MECDLGDLALFHEAYGAGRPIVILPGRPSDHRIMARLMEPVFAQRDGWLRLHPDLPGTRRIPTLDHLDMHDQMLDVVLAFTDRVIPGQRFVLAGLSYRGTWHEAWSITGRRRSTACCSARPMSREIPRRPNSRPGPRWWKIRRCSAIWRRARRRP